MKKFNSKYYQGRRQDQVEGSYFGGFISFAAGFIILIGHLIFG